MVTLIYLIDRLFNERRILPMKKWSTRYLETNDGQLSHQAKSLKKKIRKIFKIISGDDVVSMLKYVLNKKEKEELVPDKYKNAVKNMSTHYNNTELKLRHNIIRPIKEAGFCFNKIRQLGYKISRKLWRECHDTSDRNKGGGQSIKLDLREAIKSFLITKSCVSSNRLIKDKETQSLIPIRYLEDNNEEIFKDFPFKNELSKSTFMKYLKKSRIFKKPYRLTDLCDYCEWLKQKRVEINNWIEQLNYECRDKFEINNFKTFVNNHKANIDDELYANIISTIENYQVVIYHKMIANSQREAYSFQKKSSEFLKENILIEVDFKQKILIGKSPRQINKEYYNQELRICLGFGVFYLEQEEIKCVNFNLIWKDDDKEHGQNGESVVRGFRILRSQEFFKRVDNKNYSIWSDCGSHFRNSIVFGYLFDELKKEDIHVNLNFFCEKHGKNSRDTHFSYIQKFINYESLVRQLNSSQDIVDAIIKRQEKSNENRISKGLEPIITKALALDKNIVEAYSSSSYLSMKVIDQSTYYNYRTIGEDFKLVSSIFSNKVKLVDVKIQGSDNFDDTYIFPDETNIPQTLASFERLFSKQQKIRRALIILDMENNNVSQNITQNIAHNNLPQNSRAIIANQEEIPESCRSFNTKKKKSCIQCTQICSISIDDLTNERYPVGQKVVLDELQRHGHPKSKVMSDGIARTTSEARDELIIHYKYAHQFP